MFKEYLLERHRKDLLEILEDPDVNKYFSLNVNFVDLFAKDSKLANSLLSSPDDTLQKCNEIATEAQMTLVAQNHGKVIKDNVTVRVYDLLSCDELRRSTLPDNNDVGLFLQVSGTVVRMTSQKMLEYKRVYMCRKCKHKVTVEGNYEQKYLITPPKYCKNPEGCQGANMIACSELDTTCCKDYREIKLQEDVSRGSIPYTMWVTLEDDLVDMCKPGDAVRICGTVKRRWGPFKASKPIEVELVLKANHVQINNDTSSKTVITTQMEKEFVDFWEQYADCPLDGRAVILRSFCPEIYGMYLTKLAVVTVLAGGSIFHKEDGVGTRTRTEPHLLMVGDPGTGKSQLLKYAASVIPRSVLTTGIGSTSAGLTVAAVMEDGEWQLEGGALVLADGGICCIDEFNSMKQQDRTSIHEAMEQQTLSVAKASIVCKLNTRCSILAATNPKGGLLDLDESLTINTSLASPLLSRFDLILFLKEQLDEDWDRRVADYILAGRKHKSKFFEDKYSGWSLEKLQAYFVIIKRINPVMTPAANKILGAYYQSQRRSEVRNKARTTARLLDSLVRLSQAHARLMFHERVEVMDAVSAIHLIDASFEVNLPKYNPIAQFPDDPTKDYDELARDILEQLRLTTLLEENPENCRESLPKRTVGKKVDVTMSQIERVQRHIDLEIKDVPVREANCNGSASNSSDVANENEFRDAEEESFKEKSNTSAASALNPSVVEKSADTVNQVEESSNIPNKSFEETTENVEVSQRTRVHSVLSKFSFRAHEKKIEKPAKNIEIVESLIVQDANDHGENNCKEYSTQRTRARNALNKFAITEPRKTLNPPEKPESNKMPVARNKSDSGGNFSLRKASSGNFSQSSRSVFAEHRKILNPPDKPESNKLPIAKKASFNKSDSGNFSSKSVFEDDVDFEFEDKSPDKKAVKLISHAAKKVSPNKSDSCFSQSMHNIQNGDSKKSFKKTVSGNYSQISLFDDDVDLDFDI